MSGWDSSLEEEDREGLLADLCRKTLQQVDALSSEALDRCFPGVSESVRETYGKHHSPPEKEDQPEEDGKWVTPVPCGFCSATGQGLLPPPLVPESKEENPGPGKRAQKQWGGFLQNLQRHRKQKLGPSAAAKLNRKKK